MPLKLKQQRGVASGGALPLKQMVQLRGQPTANSRVAASARHAFLQLLQQPDVVHHQGAGRQQLPALYRL